jgi:hypothetical protein
MITKERIIEEIKRVAEKLEVKELSQKQFEMNSTIPMETVKYHIGNWDQVMKQADLSPASPEKGKPKAKDDPEDQSKVKTSPPVTESETGMTAEDTGLNKEHDHDWDLPFQGEEESVEEKKIKFIPQIIKPKQTKSTARTLGDPIRFRGMTFAPADKNGVIFLFGMIAAELGFVIESFSPEFPDCLARRCVDLENNRWEQTRIQFEYRCSDTDESKLQDNGCDLIVCWIHDLKDCPVEILELKSEMERFDDFSRE